MRTEKEIFKEFEKFGYLDQFGGDVIWVLQKRVSELQLKRIIISIQNKVVRCSTICGDRPEAPYYLEIQELKLLNELFEIWGWLDE